MERRSRPRESLLIVNNDADLTCRWRSHFEKRGYTVRCVASPEMALSVLRARFFHAIVLDQDLSDFFDSGILAQIRNHSNAAVILMPNGSLASA